MSKPEISVAVIRGDGIGGEVIDAALPALDAAATAHGTSVRWEQLGWGGAWFADTGRFMPEDGIDQLRGFDAILLGAVGDPQLPGDPAVSELILPIRRSLDLYLNLRPVSAIPGIPSPLRDERVRDLDILFVRENTEGEYIDRGRIDRDVAEQTGVFTRAGTERVVRYAFEKARQRGGRLVSVSKTNALRYSMRFWDSIVEEVSADYPDVEWRTLLVDAAAYELVRRPWEFDVVVASNLFGDILTDLGAAVQGSLGAAPSANISGVPGVPGFFEPVHGSAPDIAGKGIANPLGAIFAGVMMFEELGLARPAAVVRAAVGRVLTDGIGTPDIGGTASTASFGDAVRSAVDGAV